MNLIPKPQHGSASSSSAASSQLELWTPAPSPTSDLLMCVGSISAIFSLGSVAGVKLSELLDGQSFDVSGPVHLPANRTQSRGKAKATKIQETSGRISFGSSASVALQQSLASRLAAQQDLNGSMEYLLTWKVRATPVGRLICALRASDRPTDAKGFSGWPTPMAGSPGTENYNPAGNTDSSRRTVKLVGWATPASRDWKDTPGMATVGINPDGSQRNRTDQLPRQAALGIPMTSSPVPTGTRAAYNPAHGRWLMGYGIEWDESAAMAMQSFRKSPRNSSKRSSNNLHL